MDLGLGLGVSVRLLHSLHFLLAVTVPLLLTLLLAGCMKATEKKEDLGPEFAATAINAALARATAGADPLQMAIGQYLDTDETRVILNNSVATTMGARRVEVIDRQDTTDKAKVTLRISKATRQEDGTFETVVTEDSVAIDKTTTTIPASLRALPPPTLTVATLAARANAAGSTTKFYHLQESDASIDPPVPVKARAGCGGLSGCQLPVHYVQFDMVLWKDDVNYQKISIDFAFSHATPFLPFGADFNQLSGVLITDCRSTYVTVDGRNIYVRDCSTLADFKK